MPRLGMGMPIAGGATEAAVLAVEDFVFLNDVSGELTPVDTSSRTNLILYSEDFSQSSWTKTGSAAVTSNNKTSPDTTQNASTLSIPNGSFFFTAISTGAGTFTLSCHVKVSSGTLDFKMQSFNGTDGAQVSDTFTATTAWRRFEFTSTVTVNSNFYPVQISSLTGGNFDIWGAQLEDDSRVSNYIPTSGSAVSVATTELGDLSNVWDFDGTDIMLEVDPENEGAFEEATQNLVLNHDYEDLGSEEVTNGDFSSFTGDNPDNFLVLNEDANNFVTESSGQLRMVSDNSATIAIRAQPTDMLTVGKIYRVSVDLTFTTGSIDISGKSFNTSGTKVFNLTAPATYLQIAKSSALDVLIDNLSIKQVDPNDRWTLGTGWSISDGKAVATSCTNENLVGALSILIGNAYEVTFTVSDYSGSGTVKPMLGTVGAVSGTTVNADGTYTQILVADANQSAIAFRAGGTAFTGKIDNVTVKEYAITPLNV